MTDKKAEYNKIVEERRNTIKKRQESIDKWVKSKAGDGAAIGIFIGRVLGYIIGGVLGAITLAFAGGNEDLGFLSFYVGSSLGELVGIVLGLVVGGTVGLLYGKSKKIEKEISLEKKDIAVERQKILEVTNSDKHTAPAVLVSSAAVNKNTDNQLNKIKSKSTNVMHNDNNSHVIRYQEAKNTEIKSLQRG